MDAHMTPLNSIRFGQVIHVILGCSWLCFPKNEWPLSIYHPHINAFGPTPMMLSDWRAGHPHNYRRSIDLKAKGTLNP